MLAEFETTLPENVRRIHFTEIENAEWIDEVSQVLGKPTYMQTPEENQDSLQEITIYHLRSGEEESRSPNTSKTVVTIIRNISHHDRDPLFKADIKVLKGDIEAGTYQMVNIADIFLDKNSRNIYLAGYENKNNQQKVVSINSAGEVIEYQFPNEA